MGNDPTEPQDSDPGSFQEKDAAYHTLALLIEYATGAYIARIRREESKLFLRNRTAITVMHQAVTNLDHERRRMWGASLSELRAAIEQYRDLAEEVSRARVRDLAAGRIGPNPE